MGKPLVQGKHFWLSCYLSTSLEGPGLLEEGQDASLESLPLLHFVLCTQIALFDFFFTAAYGDGEVKAGSVFKTAKILSMFALSHGQSRGM